MEPVPHFRAIRLAIACALMAMQLSLRSTPCRSATGTQRRREARFADSSTSSLYRSSHCCTTSSYAASRATIWFSGTSFSMRRSSLSTSALPERCGR